jgi:hypothetical protein
MTMLKFPAVTVLSILLSMVASESRNASRTECQVKGVYTALDVPVGIIMVSALNDITEVEYVLAPAKLEKWHIQHKRHAQSQGSISD